MRLTKSLLQFQPWHQTLQTLKSTQLHRLAEATGVKSSGTKAVLVERLEGEIPLCECPFLLDSGMGGDAMKSGTSEKSEKSAEKSTEMSILSIDMGIRNLAFTHLLVRPHSRTSITDKAKAQARTGTKAKIAAEVTLNAWRRLDITNDGIPSTFPGRAEEAKTTQSSALTSGSESKENAKEKDTFSPALYAHHAYTLLTTLLQTYKPTHILIERQRFRSAGGSAVQEWTLRVGVFEGMLYTVLYTLARQGFFTHAGTGTGVGAGDGNRGVPVPLAKGVEPSRVVRYWEDRVLSPSSSEGEGGKKKRKTSKEGKKAKIDVVGGWLSDAGETGCGDISTSLSVGNDVELQNTVNTYLAKWRGKREKSKEKTLKKDIGKLDDLADCFLQGMTWLEWQIMRGRVVREGVDFLFEDGR